MVKVDVKVKCDKYLGMEGVDVLISPPTRWSNLIFQCQALVLGGSIGPVWDRL
jgi:hypothetical protein